MIDTNHLANDCWIVSQLTGIRMLEKELSQALVGSDRPQPEALRLQVDRLKSWVRQVDDVLSSRSYEESELSPARS